MTVFLEALALVARPDVLSTIAIASFLGIVIGAIPGLTAVMGVALLVPITFFMDPVPAISKPRLSPPPPVLCCPRRLRRGVCWREKVSEEPPAMICPRHLEARKKGGREGERERKERTRIKASLPERARVLFRSKDVMGMST